MSKPTTSVEKFMELLPGVTDLFNEASARIRELEEARAYYKTRYEKSADHASELERTIDELQQKLVDLHIRLQAERVELQARIYRAPRPPDYRRNELWTMELARRFSQWYNTDGPGREVE